MQKVLEHLQGGRTRCTPMPSLRPLFGVLSVGESGPGGGMDEVRAEEGCDAGEREEQTMGM